VAEDASLSPDGIVKCFRLFVSSNEMADRHVRPGHQTDGALLYEHA
jgi:hypothetical protein